jgi:hypothetical protein
MESKESFEIEKYERIDQILGDLRYKITEMAKQSGLGMPEVQSMINRIEDSENLSDYNSRIGYIASREQEYDAMERECNKLAREYFELRGPKEKNIFLGE